MILGHPAVPQELMLIPLSIPPEAAVEPAYPKLFKSSTLPQDSPPLDVKWMAEGCQIPDQICPEIDGAWNHTGGLDPPD